MVKIFGLPIMAGIVAGILFPYAALTLMPFGFVALFALMLFSGFSIDWAKLPGALRRPYPLCLALFLLFLFFPFLQLVLARLFQLDKGSLMGLVFGALMPVAFVAPFFTRELKGDEELAFLIMVISMLVAPFAAPLLLRIMVGSVVPIQVAPFMKSMLILVTLPLLASYLISVKVTRLKIWLTPYLAPANMAALTILIFILFGNAVGSLNIGYVTGATIGKLLFLAFFQDFGVLFIARFLAGRLLSPREANAVMVSLSMKNVAIATGILLFHEPRSSLAPALVFIAHACLYSFLPIFKKRLAITQ